MLFDPFGEENKKKKRVSVSKKEWEVKKATYGNKCIICGKTEKSVGTLEKAHLRAHSKGGSQVVPMCPTCHKKYDKGQLTSNQLKKLGLDKASYKKLQPKKGGAKKEEDLFKIDMPTMEAPKIELGDPFGTTPKKRKSTKSTSTNVKKKKSNKRQVRKRNKNERNSKKF